MKSNGGIKAVFDGFFDSSRASSTFMKSIVQNIRIVTLETKKLTDVLLHISDRLDQHEQAISDLYDSRHEKKAIDDYFRKSKETSKPN